MIRAQTNDFIIRGNKIFRSGRNHEKSVNLNHSYQKERSEHFCYEMKKCLFWSKKATHQVSSKSENFHFYRYFDPKGVVPRFSKNFRFAWKLVYRWYLTSWTRVMLWHFWLRGLEVGQIVKFPLLSTPFTGSTRKFFRSGLTRNFVKTKSCAFDWDRFVINKNFLSGPQRKTFWYKTFPRYLITLSYPIRGAPPKVGRTKNFIKKQSWQIKIVTLVIR